MATRKRRQTMKKTTGTGQCVGYCVRCKCKQTMQNCKKVKTKKNRFMMKGVCQKCQTKMNKFI